MLLHSLVEEVVDLATHGVVHRVKTGLIWNRLDDGLESLLKLLIVETHAGCHRKLAILLLLAEVHLRELLGGGRHVDELLLETHLLLSEVLVGSAKLFVNTWIHLAIGRIITNVNLGWSKYLFG